MNGKYTIVSDDCSVLRADKSIGLKSISKLLWEEIAKDDNTTNEDD